MDTPDPAEKALFGPVPFPGWVKEFRASQWDAIEQVHELFKEVDVVFLQAPTGTGKSLIGDAVRRLGHYKTLYSCTTKALQDQFERDFPYARVVKGRGNYLTESGKLDQFGNPSYGPWSYITCADCTYNSKTGDCRWCYTRNLCPYIVARTRAQAAELAVLNTSYLLTDLNKGQANFEGRGLAIIDEADKLEEELLGHVGVEISPTRQALLGIDPPAVKTQEAKSNDWIPWVNDHAIPKVSDHIETLIKPWDSDATADDIRVYQSMHDLRERLGGLAYGIAEGRWVYDGYDDGDIKFSPVMVNEYGRRLLFNRFPKYLLMSATILSPDMMADELGISGYRKYGFVDVPSSFPVESRPIYVSGVADMTYKNKETAWPQMVEGVKAVMRRHPDVRILVHTVSYGLARYLHEHLADAGRPLVTYTSSREKAEALVKYRKRSNSVMLASSMDRGIDLPHDLCRVQIVAKIPFPHVADKRINARMYSPGGMAWYRLQAIRTLIQMCGRGMRSEDDWCKTYILDDQFLTNLWKSDHLFPQYWKDALNFRLTARRLLQS